MLANRGAKIEFPAVISKCTGNGAWHHLAIGPGSFVGRVELQMHDQVTIGQNVIINDGARLLTGSHDIASADFELQTGPICLRDYAWVATGAIILPGVTIGRGAVVGAGAVISKDVPDYAVAVGNPARILTRRRPRNLRYQPLRHLAMIEAWLGRCKNPAPASRFAAAA
jgi:maltose O-acetyltransferase